MRELQIPEEANAELVKARRARLAGHPEQEIGYLLNAIEIYPDLYEAHNNLAVVYSRLGRLDEAVAALVRSVEIEPGDARSLRNLGQLYLARREFEPALGVLAQAVELEPDNGLAVSLVAEAYAGLRDCAKALRLFDEASMKGAEDRVHLGRGLCYAEVGKLELALIEFRYFVMTHPEDPRLGAVNEWIAALETHLVGIRAAAVGPE